MKYAQRFGPQASPFDLEAVLGSMSSEQLRELIQSMLPFLDQQRQAKFCDRILDAAARNGSSGMPDGPSAEEVANVVTFAEEAQRDGVADPAEVERFLRAGSDAMRSGDYRSAAAIYRVLLVPMSHGHIGCGRPDRDGCADLTDEGGRYLVSVYMSSPQMQRADEVWAACNSLGESARLWSPLETMERFAHEPLPQFEDFLERWRELLESAMSAGDSSGGSSTWESDEERWLRDVVRRLEGSAGLAERARTTGRAEDFRGWCDAVAAEGDWQAALAANVEAAETVSKKAHWRSGFLDGAALAAQELGRRDLPARLEAAWRESPTAIRLRRWLGSAKTRATLRKRAAQALSGCPSREERQRALLHLLLGDHAAAAKRLAMSPGLGWSESTHPGHLLFPLFRCLLGATGDGARPDAASMTAATVLVEQLEGFPDRDGPKLLAPTVAEILLLARVGPPATQAERDAVCAAMRTAADKRVVGVSRNQRHRYYDHAATLVAMCVEVDPSPSCARWVAKLRADHSRYPSLRRALDDAGVPR